MFQFDVVLPGPLLNVTPSDGTNEAALNASLPATAVTGEDGLGDTNDFDFVTGLFTVPSFYSPIDLVSVTMTETPEPGTLKMGLLVLGAGTFRRVLDAWGCLISD